MTDVTMKTPPVLSNKEFSDKEMHDSGLPVKGELGTAKFEVWALSVGLFVMALLLAAAFLDYAP